MRNRLVVAASVLATLCLLVFASPAAPADWGWKKSTSPDDVMKFLNGTPPYKGAKDVVKITAANKGAFLEFIVFYKVGGTPGWGWKKATTVDDALNFLNGKPPYKPLKAAEIAAVNRPTYTEFYIFYKPKK